MKMVLRNHDYCVKLRVDQQALIDQQAQLDWQI